METYINAIFKVKRKIGAGSFGEIYSGIDTQTGQEVAIKIESKKIRCPQLGYESRLYKLFANGVNIAHHFWYGSDNHNNIMVIDRLNHSIEDLFNICGRKFDLKTVLMLSDQMISSIEYIHSHHYVHRDIKPDNFMIGRGALSNKLYIIDFGLAKKFEDPVTLVHIPYMENKALTGTARYASIGALLGHEQSRRDDLESLAYVLIYLLKGSLPWMGISARNRSEKYDKILAIKIKTSVEELCSGLPPQFAQFLRDARNLPFTAVPHYSQYRSYFRDLLIKQEFVYDYKYLWLEKKGKKAKKANQAFTKSPKLSNPGKRNPILMNSRLVPKEYLSKIPKTPKVATQINAYRMRGFPAAGFV